MQEETARLQAMLHKIDAGEMTIVPKWVCDTTEADLLAGGVGLIDDYRTDAQTRQGWCFLSEGLILATVEFSCLLPAFNFEYRQELAEEEFINHQALKIMEEWNSGVKLTAPFCALTVDQDEVQVFVGNHRTNTALRVGAATIPLLIPKAQLLGFKQLLGEFPFREQPAIVF